MLRVNPQLAGLGSGTFNPSAACSGGAG
jgi:hypothetical protein